MTDDKAQAKVDTPDNTATTQTALTSLLKDTKNVQAEPGISSTSLVALRVVSPVVVKPRSTVIGHVVRDLRITGRTIPQ